MVFTGTDPEYSVKDYPNAVTANLVLNIGPEPVHTTSSKLETSTHSFNTNHT